MIAEFPNYVDKKNIKIELDESLDLRYLIRIPIRSRKATDKKVLVILKNPSKAKVNHDSGIYESDTTVNRILEYFMKHNYSEVSIVNLFARYFTYSEDLNQFTKTPKLIIGEQNDNVLERSINSNEYERIIVAWGGFPKNSDSQMKELYKNRIKAVEKLLKDKNTFYVEKMVDNNKFPKHAMVWYTKESRAMYKYNSVFYLNQGDDQVDFKEYLRKKHVLKKDERKLKEISIEQYSNRLENMRRDGIYNNEKHIDSELKRKVQERYSDWKTYIRTIEYFIASKHS
jgi:hypothetical protein